MTPQIKQLLIDNPNLQSGKLASITGMNKRAINKFKKQNGLTGKWSYSGVGIPFITFDSLYRVKYKHRYVVARNNLNDAIEFLEHLIWCIENRIFDLPRIEHPYLKNITFGE